MMDLKKIIALSSKWIRNQAKNTDGLDKHINVMSAFMAGFVKYLLDNNLLIDMSESYSIKDSDVNYNKIIDLHKTAIIIIKKIDKADHRIQDCKQKIEIEDSKPKIESYLFESKYSIEQYIERLLNVKKYLHKRYIQTIKLIENETRN